MEQLGAAESPRIDGDCRTAACLDTAKLKSRGIRVQNDSGRRVITVRGACALTLYDAKGDPFEHEAALRHLGEALAHWKQYAGVRDAHYVPALCNRVGQMNVIALTEKVAADLDFARHWKPGTLQDDGRRSGSEQGLRISRKETSTDRIEQQFATPRWVMEAGAKGGYYRMGQAVGPEGPWEPVFDDPVSGHRGAGVG